MELLRERVALGKRVRSSEPDGSVVFYRCDPQASMSDHDLSTKAEVARAIADLLGYAYAGQFDSRDSRCGPLYVVPSHTLSDPAKVRRLGIRGAADFFGGVVPHAFVGTKAISHRLIRADATAPEGWSNEYADYIDEVVLPGYTAFSPQDVIAAGVELLAGGAVRLKDTCGVGGAGQIVVEGRDELEAHVERAYSSPAHAEALHRLGLVIERNLSDVKTYSVGQVQVGDWQAAYFGTQDQTPNHRGESVYGGSDLTVLRGSLGDLLGLELDTALHTSVRQAMRYHAGVAMFFPGMFASRCNYDVAHGVDAEGRVHSGVLEQSWRIGGASGAEVAALHAFRDNPQLRMVRASTREVYGGAVAPPDAWVHYDGLDHHGQRLTKYVEVQPHGYL